MTVSDDNQALDRAPVRRAGLLGKLMAAIRPQFRGEVMFAILVIRFSVSRRVRCPSATIRSPTTGSATVTGYGGAAAGGRSWPSSSPMRGRRYAAGPS